MPRRRRYQQSRLVYHVLNRATARQQIFSTDQDYAAFERILQAAGRRTPIRLLAYVVMPNHWHLVVWPEADDQLSEYMRWLSVTHTQRWHLAHGTAGTGSLYQGRFKSFPVETDDHFYRVVRYVERNPLRANLVRSAEAWRWSSLWQMEQSRCDVELSKWPVPRPSEWTELVNRPETEMELSALRASTQFGRPFGGAEWKRMLRMSETGR